MTAIIFLLFFYTNSEWMIPSTGIYQPLKKDEVALTPQGEIFILNFNEAQICHYDASGKLKNEIGFKGEGPGGLVSPWSMFLEEGRLFVHDRNNDTVSIFDKNDDFVKRIRLPQRGLALFKVSNGWVYGDWHYTFTPNKPAQVVWVDQNFENPIRLLSLKEKGTASGLTVNKSDGHSEGILTLVGNTPYMVAHGNRVFVAEAVGLKIHVFDVITKKEVRLIRISAKPIPFDNGWAKREVEEIQKSYTTFKIQLKKLDYFPIIRDFKLGHDGLLYIDRWRGDPENHHFQLVLDELGKEIKTGYDFETFQRVIGQTGDWVYVTDFNKDNEEAFLTRCLKSELDAYVAGHPIMFDGDAGRTLNR